MIRAEEFDYILTPAQKGGTIPEIVVMEAHPGLQSTYPRTQALLCTQRRGPGTRSIRMRA